MLNQIKKEFQEKANPEKSKILQGFFKTGKGEYGEGDIFLGITVPEQRKIAKKYTRLPLTQLKKLLTSKFHEHRLTSLIILTQKYTNAISEKKKEIYDFYLSKTKNINNWDLVDLSAPTIVGAYLLDKPRTKLYQLANSKDLWEKRIAIISTYALIRNNQFEDTLRISEVLMHDKHDLIHKAVGWMLREVGKRNQQTLESFLKKHHKHMPRTMLRYAIEKFPQSKRKYYLQKQSK
ncbi:MAG: DNA alkylation repair protein [Nanoarchaeota archaeon]|nr:DNA alkylation repair protein [Nanoarchaeota archaeon]